MGHESLISKRAIRVLGIAESFKLTHPKSVLTGIVMRSDFIIDGVVNSYSTVGGLDVTDSIISMFKGLNRPDVHAVMIDGCIISFYNIVDIDRLHDELGLPAMCLSFSRNRGNPRAAIVKLFKDYEVRLSILSKIGEPALVNTKYGPIWVRYRGLSYSEARVLITKYQRDGRRPEPLRVSRLISASVFRSIYGD